MFCYIGRKYYFRQKRTHEGKCRKGGPAVDERVPAFKVSIAHVWRKAKVQLAKRQKDNCLVQEHCTCLKRGKWSVRFPNSHGCEVT